MKLKTLTVYNLLVQLPECLRIIGYLRRIGVFNEYEMRLQVRLLLLVVISFSWFFYSLHQYLSNFAPSTVSKVPSGMAFWDP